MDRTTVAAVNDLREAVGAYIGYCEWVERGTLLVNAEDDPEDLIEAARLNVGERIRVCQSLGLADEEIEGIVIDVRARR